MDSHQKVMLLASLAEHGTCRATVQGTSMWPFVKNGDRVVIHEPPLRPRRGMVVAFFVGEQLVIHRIAGCRKDGEAGWRVSTKGDAMPGSRLRVLWKEIAGTVERIERGNREYIAWLQPPWSLVAAQLGIALRFLTALRRVWQHSGFSGHDDAQR
ncbi:MAG: hypothetical protein GF418_15145 [Chitinivibrionales bacterium]|nr:hypothetical protein [Chitinivibrionales bacterium]MBD3396957.1 hypothetical protein [Chitinivibrionales bacterium]